jgi:hypothetical protein
LTKRAGAKVYLAVAGSTYHGLKAGVYLLFEGYVNDIAPVRGVGAASLNIGLIHWLSDLTLGNKLCDFAHPATPSALLRPVLPNVNGSTIPGYNPNFRNIANTTRNDVWGNIKDIFMAITDLDPLAIHNMTAAYGGYKNYRKQKVSSVVGRMDKDIDTVPMVFTAGAEDYINFAFTKLADLLVSPDTGTTFFDTLRFCAESFMFSVVSTAHSVTGVPLVPTFGTDPYATIYANEYDSPRITATGGLPLRGVGFMSHEERLVPSGAAELYRSTLSGLFDVFMTNSGVDASELDRVSGQVLILPTPAWIKYESDKTNNISWFRPTAPGQGGNASTALQPPSQSTETPTETEAALRNSFANSGLGFNLAKLVYLSKVFGDRRMNISGKLRLDIAPGSCVAVETVGRSLASIYGGADNQLLYGCVQGVTVTVDATRAHASTAFDINSIRTTREYKMAGFRVETHPVFTQMWSGTYLSKPLTGGAARTVGANLLKSAAPTSALRTR